MAMKKILALTLFSGILGLTGCGLNQPSAGIVGGYEDIDNWSNIETGSLSFDSNGHVQFNNVEINIFSIVQGSDKKGLEDIIYDFNNLYKSIKSLLKIIRRIYFIYHLKENSLYL